MRYEGQAAYPIRVAGVRRTLPVEQVQEDIWIPFFHLWGDVELTNACGRELASRLRPLRIDALVSLTAKSVPLVHMIATYLSEPRHGQFVPYVACRRAVKPYMSRPVSVDARSITETQIRPLVLNGPDAKRIEGKHVALIDDVVSTGGAMRGGQQLMQQIGATVAARVCVMREGDLYQDPELIYLENLPVFTR
jgi:adenine phosphoribosyltransferase